MAAHLGTADLDGLAHYAPGRGHLVDLEEKFRTAEIFSLTMAA
jgi:hypothetical protein